MRSVQHSPHTLGIHSSPINVHVLYITIYYLLIQLPPRENFFLYNRARVSSRSFRHCISIHVTSYLFLVATTKKENCVGSNYFSYRKSTRLQFLTIIMKYRQYFIYVIPVQMCCMRVKYFSPDLFHLQLLIINVQSVFTTLYTQIYTDSLKVNFIEIRTTRHLFLYCCI